MGEQKLPFCLTVYGVCTVLTWAVGGGRWAVDASGMGVGEPPGTGEVRLSACSASPPDLRLPSWVMTFRALFRALHPQIALNNFDRWMVHVLHVCKNCIGQFRIG